MTYFELKNDSKKILHKFPVINPIYHVDDFFQHVRANTLNTVYNRVLKISFIIKIGDYTRIYLPWLHLHITGY